MKGYMRLVVLTFKVFWSNFSNLKERKISSWEWRDWSRRCGSNLFSICQLVVGVYEHTHIQCAMCEQHCKELGVQIPGCVSSTKQQSIDHRIIAGQHERYCTMETLSNARERQQQLQSKAIYNNVPALRGTNSTLVTPTSIMVISSWPVC